MKAPSVAVEFSPRGVDELSHAWVEAERCERGGAEIAKRRYGGTPRDHLCRAEGRMAKRMEQRGQQIIHKCQLAKGTLRGVSQGGRRGVGWQETLSRWRGVTTAHVPAASVSSRCIGRRSGKPSVHVLVQCDHADSSCGIEMLTEV